MSINLTIFSLSVNRDFRSAPLFTFSRERQSVFSKCSFTRIFPEIFRLNNIKKLSIQKSKFENIRNSIIVLDKADVCTYFDIIPSTTKELTDCYIDVNGPLTAPLFILNSDPSSIDSPTTLIISQSTITNACVNHSVGIVNSVYSDVYFTNVSISNIRAYEYPIAFLQNSPNSTFVNFNVTNCTTWPTPKPEPSTGGTGQDGKNPGTGQDGTSQGTGQDGTSQGTGQDGTNQGGSGSSTTDSGAQTNPSRKLLAWYTKPTKAVIFGNNSILFMYGFIFDNREVDTANPANEKISSHVAIYNAQFAYIRYGIFYGANCNYCLDVQDSSQVQLLSVGFLSQTYPISISNSGLIGNHLCKDTTNEYVKSSTDSVVSLIDSDFTKQCNEEAIKAPTVPPATDLTKSQKIAAIVTLVFFIVYFVAVFVTLISLVFCKVGLSEELTFSENHSFEEESFESFAN